MFFKDASNAAPSTCAMFCWNRAFMMKPQHKQSQDRQKCVCSAVNGKPIFSFKEINPFKILVTEYVTEYSDNSHSRKPTHVAHPERQIGPTAYGRAGTTGIHHPGHDPSLGLLWTRRSPHRSLSSHASLRRSNEMVGSVLDGVMAPVEAS